MPEPVKVAPVSLSTAQLLAQTQREYILVAGKDGAGKSCFLVSMAAFVQQVLNPDATFYVIDTENKFPTAVRSFGSDAPTNIVYFKCETMNEANIVIDHIMSKRKAGDWLAVESMGRIWEKAQDMGYQSISGYTKSAYLEKRRELAHDPKVKANIAVIPKPDDFWNVVKGAHDSGFLELISQAASLNAILSTTISKPPKADAFIKENADRKAARIEFGMDAGIEGAPRLPYHVETLALLDAKNGEITCRVVRDNVSSMDESRKEFVLAGGRKMGAYTFWSECRG